MSVYFSNINFQCPTQWKSRRETKVKLRVRVIYCQAYRQSAQSVKSPSNLPLDRVETRFRIRQCYLHCHLDHSSMQKFAERIDPWLSLFSQWIIWKRNLRRIVFTQSICDLNILYTVFFPASSFSSCQNENTARKLRKIVNGFFLSIKAKTSSATKPREKWHFSPSPLVCFAPLNNKAYRTQQQLRTTVWPPLPCSFPYFRQDLVWT